MLIYAYYKCILPFNSDETNEKMVEMTLVLFYTKLMLRKTNTFLFFTIFKSINHIFSLLSQLNLIRLLIIINVKLYMINYGWMETFRQFFRNFLPSSIHGTYIDGIISLSTTIIHHQMPRRYLHHSETRLRSVESMYPSDKFWWCLYL